VCLATGRFANSNEASNRPLSRPATRACRGTCARVSLSARKCGFAFAKTESSVPARLDTDETDEDGFLEGPVLERTLSGSEGVHELPRRLHGTWIADDILTARRQMYSPLRLISKPGIQAMQEYPRDAAFTTHGPSNGHSWNLIDINTPWVKPVANDATAKARYQNLTYIIA
jgi:hypothetical protein